MSQEPEEGGGDVKPKLSLTISYDGQQVQIRVRANTSFAKIFEAAEKRFGKTPGTLKFTYDGNRIQKTDTPAGLDIEDDDQIDAFLEQQGGGCQWSELICQQA